MCSRYNFIDCPASGLNSAILLMSLPAVMDPRLLPAVVMTDPRHHVTGNAYTRFRV